MTHNAMTVILISREIIYVEGTGISKAISISNTKKITAKIKNCREKGIRAELWGSNPHSNGVAFSANRVLFFLKRAVAIMMAVGSAHAIDAAVIIVVIFLGGGVPVYKVKICCCCKLLRNKCWRVISCLTSSKLSVHPAQHHIVIVIVSIIADKVRGKNCFHVNHISLS